MLSLICKQQSHFLFQVYRKLVQIGRVVYISDGRYKGKLATIVDIIDSNKVSRMRKVFSTRILKWNLQYDVFAKGIIFEYV